MGWLFGMGAVDAILAGSWGKMVSASGVAPACDISLVPLADAVGQLNLVDVARHYDTQLYSFRRGSL